MGKSYAPKKKDDTSYEPDMQKSSAQQNRSNTVSNSAMIQRMRSEGLSTNKIDQTFNAYWRMLGGQEVHIDMALARTRDQIGPSVPTDYVPPPRRKKANPSQTEATASQTDSAESEKISPEQIELYLQNAPLGIQLCQREVDKEKQQIKNEVIRKYNDVPMELFQQIVALKQKRLPLDQELKQEIEIVDRYWADKGGRREWEARRQSQPDSMGAGDPNFKYSDKPTKTPGQSKLEQLAWMTKNPLGSGKYGIERQRGAPHDLAFQRAKELQAVVDPLLKIGGTIKPHNKLKETMTHGKTSTGLPQTSHRPVGDSR